MCYLFYFYKKSHFSLETYLFVGTLQRIMESISANSEVGGAGGAYSYNALKRLDQLWSHICSADSGWSRYLVPVILTNDFLKRISATFVVLLFLPTIQKCFCNEYIGLYTSTHPFLYLYMIIEGIGVFFAVTCHFTGA